MKVDEERTNPDTNKLEIKLEPDGLPPIWVSVLCNRCEKFQECLGFKNLTEEEWNKVDFFIKNLNTASTEAIKLQEEFHLECKRTCFSNSNVKD